MVYPGPPVQQTDPGVWMPKAVPIAESPAGRSARPERVIPCQRSLLRFPSIPVSSSFHSGYSPRFASLHLGHSVARGFGLGPYLGDAESSEERRVGLLRPPLPLPVQTKIFVMLLRLHLQEIRPELEPETGLLFPELQLSLHQVHLLQD